MSTGNNINRIISILLIAILLFGVATIPEFSSDDTVYAASDSVKKYRNKITKNRKYIQKKVKTFKSYKKYLTKAKDLEKKSKNTKSLSTLKSYDKKVASYANKIKKVQKTKRKRVSWYKAPHIAGKKSITWSSVDKGCKKLLGIPYKWGGSTKKGFDCSGLVSYVLDKNYGLSYNRYSSASAKSKWGNSKYEVYDSKYDGDIRQAIDDDRVRPGDIVVHIREGKVYHISIFAGYQSFGWGYGPVQYDAYNEVVKRYILDDGRRLQIYRGLYTKPSTSKAISKYRNKTAKVFTAGEKIWSNYYGYSSDYKNKMYDMKWDYQDIIDFEEGTGQQTLSAQAKVIYDQCLTYQTEIEKDWTSLGKNMDDLYEVTEKGRDSRKTATLKKYNSNAASYKKAIDSAGSRIKSNAVKFDNNLVKLNILLEQVRSN